MRTRAELAVATLESARQMLTGNLAGVTLDEALDSAGGYRTVLGILKHAAAWSHVYHSYAFEPAPRHWRAIDWPRGLRDTVEPAQEYVDEIVAWFGVAADSWVESLRGLPDEAFDEPRPCHWGETLPLFDIVVLVANHWCYHAGEVNAILSVVRGAAWEYTEEVEENHISTAGHRVRPGWMNDAQASGYEAYLATRDAQLHAEK
ncbi:MAG: DinB family protein [Chloroflexota bacterium]|nr:DinB family protein [Chloroflexota bacterium]